MAQVINTNSLSLMAQNNLNRSQSALGTAIERLSSGLRINSAKDDAAGQAISNRFTSNINGLTQASRNANDGISLAQTTEGALNEVKDNLQNIRRLSVQAANGTNSESDLQSIQDEINQRLAEINRISEQTDFNGVKVLSSKQQLTIQVGANDGEVINIDLQQMNTTTLGVETFTVTNGLDTTKLGTALTKLPNMVKPTVGADGNTTTPLTSTDGVVYTDGTKNWIQTGASQWVEGTISGGVFTFSSTTTPPVTTKPTGLTEVPLVDDGTGPAISGLSGTESLHQYTDGSYIVKDSTNNAYFKATVDATGKVTKGAAMTTEPKTAQPLAVLDKALSTVDSLLGTLGAVQNRFDSVINNLNSTVNNLTSSRSRIQDADYATEVSNMSRANILQQAGTAVLAQANQVPQNVLSLLR